ncbi:hypothetical protein BH18THE1_BH18THE1_02700 [soil metagenome]
MEKKWISHFAGIGYRYTDIIMNILILYTDRKIAIKTWNENIHWWPDDQIILRFVEEREDYWFIIYQKGKNLLSKENVGFFKKNPLTQNYLRFKKNFDQKTILRFALYKSLEKKIENKDILENNLDGSSTKATFELNIFKRMKTVYDVKFLKLNELEENSLEHSLIKNTDLQNA